MCYRSERLVTQTTFSFSLYFFLLYFIHCWSFIPQNTVAEYRDVLLYPAALSCCFPDFPGFFVIQFLLAHKLGVFSSTTGALLLQRHDDLCDFWVFATIKKSICISLMLVLWTSSRTGSLHKFSTKIHKLIVISMKKSAKSICLVFPSH